MSFFSTITPKFSDIAVTEAGPHVQTLLDATTQLISFFGLSAAIYFGILEYKNKKNKTVANQKSIVRYYWNPVSCVSLQMCLDRPRSSPSSRT